MLLAVILAAASLVPSGKLYLGIDAGTQSTKAIVYDTATRAILGRGAVSHGLLSTDVIGRAEQDPKTWVDAMFQSTRTALDQAGEGAAELVRGIGVSGQQHGLVALDDTLEVIRPCAASLSVSPRKLHGQLCVVILAFVSRDGAKSQALVRHGVGRRSR